MHLQFFVFLHLAEKGESCGRPPELIRGHLARNPFKVGARVTTAFSITQSSQSSAEIVLHSAPPQTVALQSRVWDVIKHCTVNSLSQRRIVERMDVRFCRRQAFVNCRTISTFAAAHEH